MSTKNVAMETALEPFIAMAPKALARQLRKPATFATIMTAQATFLDHALSQGVVLAIVSAMPPELTAGQYVPMTGELREKLETLMTEAQANSKGNVAKAIVAQYGGERKALEDIPQIALGEGLLLRFDQKFLTIGDVLTLQPDVITGVLSEAIRQLQQRS